MRCKACDALLTDREAARKDALGVHLDLCSPCGAVSFEAWYQAQEENQHGDTKPVAVECVKLPLDTLDP